MKTWMQAFQNPPTAYRAKPFWAWNGALEEKELLRQIRVMHEMGFGGFFMHSRTGLQTQYLGKDWFKLTDACTKEAQKLGMEAWIYDEDRWPSGPAGGLVTKDVRFRRKYLTLTLDEPETEEPPLAAFAAKLDGLHLAADYRPLAGAEACLPGETRLTFRVHTMQPQNVYNGYTDADRMSLAATERFLDITHRQYGAKCDTFDDICGVFTDEPHRGMVFSDFSDPDSAGGWSLPWTDELPQAFESAFGEPLLPRLPELFLQKNGQRYALLKWQYMELTLRLFISHYLQPIGQWAQSQGKKTTGHFLHEDSLTAQAVPTGSLMRCYEYLDEPGMDSLTQTRYTPWAVKQLSSAARQLGKKKTLSELFGATGWQMSFQDYKYVGDWQVLLGVNVRCPHLSWYTMQGEAKRDYPGSFLHQATWYREHALLETYFARLGLLASQGTPVCDTLVLHPVESLWYQIYPGWANGLDAADDNIQKLERQFRQLFDWLMQTQTDFDYGDEGLLAEHAAVEHAGGAVLRVGQMCYRRIVIGGCEGIRETTLKLLQAFSKAGGELVFVGTPPRYVAGVRRTDCAEAAADAIRLPWRKTDVLRYFRTVKKPVTVKNEAAADLYLQLRQEPDGLIALLWNKSRHRRWQDVPIQLPAGMNASLLDCTTGKQYALDVTDGCVRLDFAPGQERVLSLCAAQEALPQLPNPPQGKPIRLSAPASYQLDEPNVFVLDRASLRVDEQTGFAQDEILKLDRSLRTALGLDLRGGEMIQPWARAASDAFTPICLRYVVPIETLPAGAMLLAMEDLPGQTLRINGRPVSLRKTDRFWVDACFSVYELDPAVWHEGENVLELQADYSADSGLEAMYLLGTFGVWFREGTPTIGALPQSLKIGDITRQGLAFYSGSVTYRFLCPLAGDFTLRLVKYGGTCVSVSCGQETKNLLWSWETADLTLRAEDTLTIKTVLNRRNTFGPLHRFPRVQPYIAPDSFDNADADRYCLYPLGLLRAPELYPAPKPANEPE